MLPCLLLPWKTKKSWWWEHPWEQNDLCTVGIPAEQSEPAPSRLCALCAPSRTMCVPARSGKEKWHFPHLLAFLSLCPDPAGMLQSRHKVLTLRFSPLVPVPQPKPPGQAERPVLRGRDRAGGLHCLAEHIPASWPWILSKGRCRIICFELKYLFIVSSYQNLYRCTVLNLQVFWSMNITSSCKGAIFKMLRQLTESQPEHV